MADTSSFDSMFKALQETIPNSWGPRRPQPEWDRDFGGNADIQEHFSGRTDKAHMWLAFCLNFSETVTLGFRGPDDTDNSGLSSFAAKMRHHIAKGKKQFDA